MSDKNTLLDQFSFAMGRGADAPTEPLADDSDDNKLPTDRITPDQVDDNDDDTDIIDPKDLQDNADGGDDSDDVDDGDDDSTDNNDSDLDDNDAGTGNDVSTDDQDTDSDDDLTEVEEKIVELINEKLNNRLEFEDGEEPKTLEDYIKKIDELAEESAMPKYPSEDMEEMHKFVESGGSLEDYFNLKYKHVDLTDIDIDKESNQKLVVKSLLQEKGFSDKRIDRMLSRYEEADVLKEEAEDALEELKDLDSQMASKRAKEQELAAKKQQEQEVAMIDNIKSTIDDIEEVRGVKLTKRKKQELVDYILKPDNEGLTQYQRDYNENFSNNLIETAFLLKEKDLFMNTVNKKAKSNAAREIKSMLKNKGRRNSSTASTRRNSGNANSFDGVYSLFGHK